MRKSKNFLSLPIISSNEGKTIGKVKQLIVDPVLKKLIGFLIEAKDLGKEEEFVAFEEIQSFRGNALTVNSLNSLKSRTSDPTITPFLTTEYPIIGTKILVENGAFLGTVEDYWIDNKTGQVIFLEVKGGRLDLQYVKTIGQTVIIALPGANENLVKFRNQEIP